MHSLLAKVVNFRNASIFLIKKKHYFWAHTKTDGQTFIPNRKDHRLQIMDNGSQIMNHGSQIKDHKSQIIDH